MKIHIPPTVLTPATLFRRIYFDVMHMPEVNKKKLIIHARCSLSSYPEYEILERCNSETVAAFLFKLQCRYGAIYEIVTDNGSAMIKGVKVARERYHVQTIHISPFNSQTDGPIERRHRDVREAILKTAEGDIERWPEVAMAVFWAERVTIQKSTGFSPYYIVHGVEPVLPFDIAEATYMSPAFEEGISTETLLTTRARALLKRPADLQMVREKVLASRWKAVRVFEERYKNTIKDFMFKPGDLVLVQNSKIEQEASRKAKPKYLGPLAVVRRTQAGTYILAELDGAVSRLRYAAFRLIPYFARTSLSVPVTKIIDNDPSEMMSDDAGAEDDDLWVSAD